MSDDLEQLKAENAALRGVLGQYGEDVDEAIATYSADDDADDNDDTPPTASVPDDLNDELTDAELFAAADKAGAAGDWAKSLRLKSFVTNRRSGHVAPPEAAPPSPYASLEDGDLSQQIIQAEAEGMDFALPDAKRLAAWQRSNVLKGERLRRLTEPQL